VTSSKSLFGSLGGLCLLILPYQKSEISPKGLFFLKFLKLFIRIRRFGDGNAILWRQMKTFA